MTAFLPKLCAIPKPKKGPYTTWQERYGTLKTETATTPAALSRQWLWLLQHGSAVAPAHLSDRETLSLDHSPFVSGGGYLRTSAKAYLSKQLEQIDGLLGLNQSLVTIVPHAAVQALKTVYQNTVLIIPETAFTPKKTLTQTTKDQIQVAALQDKTIWIQLPTPAIPNDVYFMSVLKKLPVLPNKKQYKLLWSFQEIKTTKGTTKLPLTVICGSKSFLWNHPQLLSHSGYGPDKASVDMMVIKLNLACNPQLSLESVFPFIPHASGNRGNDFERAGALSIPSTDGHKFERAKALSVPSTDRHTFERTGISLDPLSIPSETEMTLYQKLGTLWVSRFETIKSTRRDDLRHNNEVRALITQLDTALTTANTQLQNTPLKDQYNAIRNMADTLLVAETLCDTDPIRPADLTCFGTQRPDKLYLTTYGMTPLTGAILSYKQVKHNPIIATMAHTYFETSGLINTIQSIAPQFCDHRAGIASIADIPADTDILVIEPHPNNVSEKSPVTPPSLETLAARLRDMCVPRRNALLIVLDITIGVVSDPELQTFIHRVSDLIEGQKLHVVMGQSLVKFGALGIDVASSGLAMIWTKDAIYLNASTTMLSDAAAPAHVQAFYKHLLTEGLPLATAYLETIRDNTQRLSDMVLGKLAAINMEKRELRVMDIHPNLDRGTCYIGIDFDAFLPQFKDATTSEKIAERVLTSLQKIAQNDAITLTGRSSFGFPFANATVCGSAIRLTIGIESEETLTQLAEAIAILGIGLKWHTQDLSDPKIDPSTTTMAQGIVNYINSTRKQNTPELTESKLVDILQTLVNIARETRIGFSRDLLSVEELCVGEYETEDGFEPDFEWQETGLGTLSWTPGDTHFDWQKENSTSQINYLEIDHSYSMTPNTRENLAITLLSIEQSTYLFDDHRLNAKLPHGMDRFALYAFGDKKNTYDIWSQDRLDAEPVCRKISIDDGTRLNGRHYPPDKVLIYHNGAYWKQSELEGEELDNWKKKLGTGHYVCHIREHTPTLQLQLTPRTNAETWRIGNKDITILVSDDKPIRVGKKGYTFDQMRAFKKPGNLSKVSSYWSLKKSLDTAPSETNAHINYLDTSIRQQTAENEWQNLLIMVPASDKEAFDHWRKEVRS
jgi:hypothetical protein